ncbi:unnamed protein product [Dibothriocephalus latus]|uniref:Uncharacterized protein n=1 Tax=Dibothriocephalus latus TaxID=60516 RepID=A0A3P7N1U8_DIBLA|nr:unnamed protein product [Dibothriocephalus latus]
MLRRPREPTRSATLVRWCGRIVFKLDYSTENGLLVLCKNMYGEDYKPCNYFKLAYKELCPVFLVEKWTDEVEEGTFPYKLC